MSSEFWIICTGALVAISCALLGCFLVLRKMALIADAISHAVLPGIVVAYLFSGSRNDAVMIPVAAFSGLLTTWIIDRLHNKGNIQSDASIGVTFTWMFAVGVIILSLFAGNIDLDQDCVLYGDIVFIPFDKPMTNTWLDTIPRAIYNLTGVLFLTLLLVWVGYRPLKLSSFDPVFAATTGVNVVFWNYLLMAQVSITTVVSFNAVGAILVVAMILVPAATAYLLTHSLSKMLCIASALGVAGAIGGYYLAALINSSISAAMAVCLGVLFAFTIGLYQFKHRYKKTAKVPSIA